MRRNAAPGRASERRSNTIAMAMAGPRFRFAHRRGPDHRAPTATQVRRAAKQKTLPIVGRLLTATARQNQLARRCRCRRSRSPNAIMATPNSSA